MFRICDAKGFHMTFDNGWTASVQWGAGNYSDNHDASFEDERTERNTQSTTAEVAAWPRDGGLVKLGSGDTVAGYLKANQVLEFLNWVASQ